MMIVNFHNRRISRMAFDRIMQLLLLFMLLFISVSEGSLLFEPDRVNATNDFSAAWLTTKERLFLATNNLQSVTNMAGATFAIIRDACKDCQSLMTYDYLDFMVEHLSSTTNQLAIFSKELLLIKLQTTKKLLHQYKRTYKERKYNNYSTHVNQTLPIIIYSSQSFSTSYHIPLQMKFRQFFIQLSIYSILFHFPSCLVYVATQDDYDFLNRLTYLPSSVHVILLNDTPSNSNNQTVLLPSRALLNIIQLIRSHDDDEDSSKVEGINLKDVLYLFYTEGDQILHGRALNSLYNSFETADSKVVIIPHRMQVTTVTSYLDPLMQFSRLCL